MIAGKFGVSKSLFMSYFICDKVDTTVHWPLESYRLLPVRQQRVDMSPIGKAHFNLFATCTTRKRPSPLRIPYE